MSKNLFNIHNLKKNIFLGLVLITFGFTIKDDYNLNLSAIRSGFYDAVMNSEKATILEKKIAHFSPQSPLIKVYKGATYAIEAKNKWNPFSALSLLGKSRKKMNEAVTLAPHNLEIRFIRFAVQKNIPSYLGYSENIKEDKKYLIKHINRFYNPKINKKMRDYILYFMTEQGGYSKKQIKLIREKLTP